MRHPGSFLVRYQAMWMRIRSPHNPDILTYRDSVVYEPHRFALEQRLLSSSLNSNGTLSDTYFLTLTILQPTIDDEGRYICSRARTVFAEYDLFIIGNSSRTNRLGMLSWLIQFRLILSTITVLFRSELSWKDRPFTSRVQPLVDRNLPSPGSIEQRMINIFNVRHTASSFFCCFVDMSLLVSDGRGCHDPVCEIHLGNYTRHDPTIIECVADNGKSTRVSKVFQVDVHCK